MNAEAGLFWQARTLEERPHKAQQDGAIRDTYTRISLPV